MNYIRKYNKFFYHLNESRIVNLPILDVVIDSNGNVLNGEDGNGLVKGRVERVNKVVTKILGTDNREYLAGIDKNGNVIALDSNIDSEFRLCLNGDKDPIKIPNNIRAKYKIKDKYYYTTQEHDYYNLIPIIPTGWVNVKIDMEIVKRVRRYSRSFGTNTKGHQSFIDKLNDFSGLSSKNRSDQYIKRIKRGRIQKEMSCILLLQYLNELKDFFNPSQSGFLFESFIAGLIPNSRIKEDNSPVDIRTTTEDRYQCKMVDYNSEYVDITRDTSVGAPSTYLDYYIIAAKQLDRIELFIINGVELESRYNNGTLGDLITAGTKRETAAQKAKRVRDNIPPPDPKPKFKISKLREIEGFIDRFEIDLSDITGRIENLGQSIKQNLDKIYEELSKFQFNVETIISGTDEKGVPLKEQSDFDRCQKSAEGNIKNLSIHLENLVADINK